MEYKKIGIIISITIFIMGCSSYDETGFNRVSKRNWHSMGYIDQEGYDISGYSGEGYDREGYDRYGYDVENYDKDGFNDYGYNREGYDRNGYKKKWLE